MIRITPFNIDLKNIQHNLFPLGRVICNSSFLEMHICNQSCIVSAMGLRSQ